MISENYHILNLSKTGSWCDYLWISACPRAVFLSSHRPEQKWLVAVVNVGNGVWQNIIYKTRRCEVAVLVFIWIEPIWNYFKSHLKWFTCNYNYAIDQELEGAGTAPMGNGSAKCSTQLMSYPRGENKINCRDDKIEIYMIKHCLYIITLISKFMGSTCGPSGADRTQVGPMNFAIW